MATIWASMIRNGGTVDLGCTSYSPTMSFCVHRDLGWPAVGRFLLAGPLDMSLLTVSGWAHERKQATGFVISFSFQWQRILRSGPFWLCKDVSSSRWGNILTLVWRMLWGRLVPHSSSFIPVNLTLFTKKIWGQLAKHEQHKRIKRKKKKEWKWKRLRTKEDDSGEKREGW